MLTVAGKKELMLKAFPGAPTVVIATVELTLPSQKHHDG